ncbi:MAG: hypothetical protein KF905_09385 [Flavobacteriales bacterium]|nr:hypothetical protein [Flavobacteriales bacterium]
MRNLIASLSIVSATALVLFVAPQVIEGCSSFIAALETYLEWIIEGRSVGGELTMQAEGPVNQ